MHRKDASCRLLAALSCVGLLASLTACSAPWKHEAQEPSGSGSGSGSSETKKGAKLASSMDALFDQYLAKKKLSSYEREVITRSKKNGKVSAEDYEAAHAKEVSCMASKGWKMLEKKLPSGIYANNGTDPVPHSEAEVDKMANANKACSVDSSDIEILYETQQTNPDLFSDTYEAAVTCLQRSKVVDKSYTAKKLKDALEGGGELRKKLPFDTSTDAAQNCLVGNGMGIDI
ncbi:hypothetical protein OZX73_08680 [Bifidobacterium sp. ESL0775]|uniref:hypothetical protein n=1 Tax=Bifidobacterium sp. ESL0775 TaxID=2983230 RepID=UPI0023F9280E|nr:hypothetical protein [Bifidobacterium sp. ESL0775]WEV69313.1 hypothetical protein OZX73_08680 [Bifidobacterium sp. ESL0775]